MIAYDKLPLSRDVVETLNHLEIDYAFQPIFHNDCKTIFAYEALMRPKHITVTDLIEEYMKLGKLHLIEVATIFGATQAFLERGYKEYLSMNSFPSETFTLEETMAYQTYFGLDILQKMHQIIEILEYPHVSLSSWAFKKEVFASNELSLALDDYGTGENMMPAVDFFEPKIVKIDRELISGIDQDEAKQKNVTELIKTFHDRFIMVVGEGVETKEECDFLVKSGIDFLQGYYLGRPQ